MNHSPIGAHQSNSTAVNTTPTDDRRPSPLATGLNSLINTYVLHPLPDSANITQMLDAAWHYLVAHPGMRDQFEMEFSTLLDSHMESAPAGETDLTMSFLGQLSIMSSRQPMQNSAPARQVGETELRSALAEFDPALRAPDVNIHTLLDRARQDLSLNLSDSTPGGAATHRLLLKLEALLRKGDISKQVRQLLHEFLNPVISQGLNRLGKPPLVNIARMAFAFNFHETLQYKNTDREATEEFKGFKGFEEFGELSVSTAPDILKKLEASRRWDLITPVIRQVTHNTIKEILAINEEYVFEDCKASEDELLKELTAAIEELRKFIMDSKIKPEVKANLLGELIYRVAEDNDCSGRKVSVMTASLRECMKDFGVMLRELSLSSHGRPELNMKILEWVISRGMDSVVDYDEDSSIIAVELIKSILKEPNNQANRITQFFDLVDTAFDTRINGESPDLLPMVNELLKAGISSELAAELYYESPHWELFEHATQDIDGLRKLEEDGTEMDIMNLIYILRNAIKSSDRNYVLSALKFLESGLNEYAKRNAESLSVNGMKLLQESFSGMLKKIEKNLVPALDVVYAIPYGLSPEQAIHWLAERFPEFPKPPASPEIDFFNYQNDFNVENDFDMEYLMEPPQSERPQVFPAEGQSGMTNNIPSRSDEAQTEKWLNRKRERSESQDSQHSQP